MDDTSRTFDPLASTRAPGLPNIPSVTVEERLGSGAFGEVYRGRHQTLDVDVAVKLVRGSATALELALSEARLMARLDHPNLVRIHDAGHAGSSIYLVLEMMDGGALADSHGLAPERLDAIATQLLAGLQALHDARIIHRDIKPANCLVRTRDDRVKLGDLGVAAERPSHGELAVAGTLPFMAPEMFESPPRVGEASDLYALGMTLACLALPKDPFPSTVEGLLDWIRHAPPLRVGVARPDLPHHLVALIEKLVAKRPEDRPSSATAALAGVVSGTAERVPAGPTSSQAIGGWVIGEQVYESDNWRSFAVTHAVTGVAARLIRLQPVSPISSAKKVIPEAAARASRLDHPGLLAVLDWGSFEDLPYVVTAPQGRSLYELVVAGGPRTEIEALDLVGDIADAVAYLHERDLVYQVVEPGAAMMKPDARHAELGWPVFCVPAGSPLRADDGSARRAGVPEFMAPEAFTSKGMQGTIEKSVDLWGLGEILYFVCAGRRAYDARGVFALAAAKMQPPISLRDRAPAITQPTARLADELLSPAVAKRPSSAAAVRDELRHIASRLRGR